MCISTEPSSRSRRYSSLCAPRPAPCWEEIPQRPFSNRETVLRLTPSLSANSWVVHPNLRSMESFRISPGWTGFLLVIACSFPTSDSLPGSRPTASAVVEPECDSANFGLPERSRMPRWLPLRGCSRNPGKSISSGLCRRHPTPVRMRLMRSTLIRDSVDWRRHAPRISVDLCAGTPLRECTIWRGMMEDGQDSRYPILVASYLNFAGLRLLKRSNYL